MSKFELLSEQFPVTDEHIEFYQKNRYIKLKHVLSADVIDYYQKVIIEEVQQISRDRAPLDQRDTYGKAFLQVMNLWREHDDIRDFVFNRRIAGIAANLMQVDGVKLYHDQALCKEAGGGYTPWHADQYYWPLSTDKTITAWIPLQATPLEMGPLEFSAGSHIIQDGRDLMISDDSEQQIEARLRVTDFPHIVEPFDLGEVSFHSGWVFHRAGPNTTDEMRKVMTIIYMDKDMTLKKPENDNQIADWNTWCPGAKIGQVISTPLNPQLFP